MSVVIMTVTARADGMAVITFALTDLQTRNRDDVGGRFGDWGCGYYRNRKDTLETSLILWLIRRLILNEEGSKGESPVWNTDYSEQSSEGGFLKNGTDDTCKERLLYHEINLRVPKKDGTFRVTMMCIIEKKSKNKSLEWVQQTKKNECDNFHQ